MLNKKELGEKLAQCRKEKGYTQQNVVDSLYLGDVVQLSRIERGLSYPSVERLRKLCLIYDVSADHILEIDEEPWYKIYESYTENVNTDYQKYRSEIETALIQYLSHCSSENHREVEKTFHKYIHFSFVSCNGELSLSLLKRIVGERLLMLHKLYGVTREQVMCGTDISVWSAIKHESGRQSITISTLYKYSKYYRIPADFIIGLVD